MARQMLALWYGRSSKDKCPDFLKLLMDSDGKPRPVPTFVPETDHGRRLNTYARKMIELRANMQDEAQSFLDELEHAPLDRG